MMMKLMKLMKHLKPSPTLMILGVTSLLIGCGNGDDDKSPKNTLPIAKPDSVQTAIDKSIIIDVLANDMDPDGDVLTIISSSILNGKGTVSIKENKLRFEPEIAGLTTVNYYISDGNGGEVSTEVSIDVTVAESVSQYVGTSTCLGCHQDKSTFIETGHNLMLQKVVDNQQPEFPFTDITGALEMVEGLINKSGDPEGYEDVSYTLGGHKTMITWLDKQGYMFTGSKDSGLLMNGYVQGPEWMISSLPLGATEANLYTFCGQCHTTGWKDYTSESDDDRNNEKQLEGILGTFEKSGVQCEACHGGGVEHVQSPSADNITKIAQPRSVIELSADDMAYGKPKACAECHTYIEGGARLYPTYISGLDAKFGGERPGAIIPVDADPYSSGSGGSTAADALLGYDPDTGVAMGPMQALHCSNCHDPHQSASYHEQPGHETAVKKCTTCHDNIAFRDAPVHEFVAECTDCHMSNSLHFFKIDISTTSDDSHNYSDDGKYRQPWLRAEESCGGCHSDDYEERAQKIGSMHK